MGKNWSIRDYEDGDEQRIVPLFNFIFNKTRTTVQWNWEFKKNPDGFKALIAEDEEENLMAHLAALHRSIKIGQTKALSSLEVDGMTHPDYARRGIFVALGKRLLSDLEEEGVSIVIGFPNEKALPGHRKMGCIELFTPDVMVRPVNFKNVSKKLVANRVLGLFSQLFGRFLFKVVYRSRKANIEGDIVIKTIERFDRRFDRFWEKACSPHNVILQRDSRYLNWRYAECPEKHYQVFVAEKDDRILGFVVVRVMELFGLRNGLIVDILALPNYENVAHALVLKAVEYLKKKEVDAIACMMPKWGEYNGVLRKCGFMPSPQKLNPKPQPFIIYPISKDIDLDAVKNPQNWLITWGDSDVV